jgi:hypothetical protein
MGVSGQHHAPAALYPRGKDPRYHWTGGWVGPRAGLDAQARRRILCLRWGSNPGRPVRSLTLYWLSYPRILSLYERTSLKSKRSIAFRKINGNIILYIVIYCVLESSKLTGYPCTPVRIALFKICFDRYLCPYVAGWSMRSDNASLLRGCTPNGCSASALKAGPTTGASKCYTVSPTRYVSSLYCYRKISTKRLLYILNNL